MVVSDCNNTAWNWRRIKEPDAALDRIRRKAE
jgi:hypothetical protein